MNAWWFKKIIYLKIYKYTFEFIVRTEMTCDIFKYESWDTGSDFTSAEILDSIYNDLDLGLWELLIKHLHWMKTDEDRYFLWKIPNFHNYFISDYLLLLPVESTMRFDWWLIWESIILVVWHWSRSKLRWTNAYFPGHGNVLMLQNKVTSTEDTQLLI